MGLQGVELGSGRRVLGLPKAGMLYDAYTVSFFIPLTAAAGLMVFRPKEIYLWATKPFQLSGTKLIPSQANLDDIVASGILMLLFDALVFILVMYGLVTRGFQPPPP